MTKLILLFSLPFVVSACDGDNKTDPADACEPIYAGEATDEVWLALIDAKNSTTKDDANAVAFVVPSDAQVFAKTDAPPTFEWTSPLAMQHHRPAEKRWEWARLQRLLGAALISTAHAHKPPITSDVYWLTIAVPGEACGVGVLTTDLSWTLTADAWQLLGDKGGTFEADIVSTYVEDNKITEGPYRPSQRQSFVVQ